MTAFFHVLSNSAHINIIGAVQSHILTVLINEIHTAVTLRCTEVNLALHFISYTLENISYTAQ